MNGEGLSRIVTSMFSSQLLMSAQATLFEKFAKDFCRCLFRLSVTAVNFRPFYIIFELYDLASESTSSVSPIEEYSQLDKVSMTDNRQGTIPHEYNVQIAEL